MLSCSKITLNRWIRIESHWYKKLASLLSPDWTEILQPRHYRKSRAQSLIGPSVSIATAWKMLQGLMRQHTNRPTGTQRWVTSLTSLAVHTECSRTVGLLSVWTAKTLWFLWNGYTCRCHGPGNQVIQGMMSGWSTWSLLTDESQMHRPKSHSVLMG